MSTGTLRSEERAGTAGAPPGITEAPPVVVAVYSEAHVDAVGVTSTIGSLALLLGLGGALGLLATNAVALPGGREGRRSPSRMTSSSLRRSRFPRFPGFSAPSPPPTIPHGWGRETDERVRDARARHRRPGG